MADDLKNVTDQSVECPVCLNTFKDPKILSCTHTFCKACLDKLLECQGNDQTLRCLVCRAETQVPNRDVSKLTANLLLKSLIEDVEKQYQVCTNCNSEDNPKAVFYCQDCGRYLCITCQTRHSKWESFSDHVVSAIYDIASGKVAIRRYRKCRKHPKEDEECFCSDCRRFACFRCSVIEHSHEGHRVIEASIFESNHLKNIEDLKSKTDKKRSYFQKYVDFIDEQKDGVSNAKKQCIVDINEAYEESVRQLTERKARLIGEVKAKTERVEKELDEMKKSAQQQIVHVSTITDLVTYGTKIPVEMNALAAHDTLRQELQEALSQEDPDYHQPMQSSKQGKCIVFERNVGMSKQGLGKIVNSLGTEIALPTKNSMNAMVPTIDGRMAVGCCKGGVEIFSADGQLQQTVLKNVKICELGFLSDGRYVVRDTSNTITLYTMECEKLDVRFETLSHAEGGYGDLTVDSHDQIYISFRKAKKIQVFSPAGGTAIKEIQCDAYEPVQITTYNDFLVIRYSNTLRIIDQEGHVKYQLTKSSGLLHATVSQWNSIMIAWVKYDEGLVSIDEYTNELEHVRNVINDYKIKKPEINWYYLQEFRSGELAFCTPDRLYIFH